MNEDHIEQHALEILRDLGWQVLHGPEIGPDGSGERKYSGVVLDKRLYEALVRINPHVPMQAYEEALKRIVRPKEPDVVLDNRHFHNLLVNGVDVEIRGAAGELRTDKLSLIDFVNPSNNEFVAVNQLTIINGEFHRRPDIVLFINGLPLGMLEIKDPTEERASLRTAFNQFQTYKYEFPNLFRFNELLIITDGIDAEAGTLSSNFERFTPWKTIDGTKEHSGVPMLEILLRGMMTSGRMIDLIRNFIVFERQGVQSQAYIKKLAAYHQYWAVNKAVHSTIGAAKPEADHRAGVVWHTQGSGKSLSMLFYAGKLAIHPELKNPTLVVITDRNDLDDQLFGTFSNGADVLREDPVQADSRADLKRLLTRESGGVVFTTSAKFFPEIGQDFPLLSDRNNIIVMADEAHRSQYNFIDGFAKHIRDALPKASFIGFTGTPIEADDRSTPAVFGDYIDIYDIQQAVEDGATVPIYYESRLIELEIDNSMKVKIDQEVDALLAAEEVGNQEEYKTKSAQLEAIVGNNKRINRIAEDIVSHFEARQDAIDGKGMIVTLSRRIAVDLYNALILLRPNWYGDRDEEGYLKVIMTGSATDPVEWQQHIRNGERRKKLADQMKNPDSQFKLAIVCDMWLTGFDAPSLHTMYLDKPMKGHNLMQSIARVNRVYKDKPGGLVVDYLGVAASLREAMATYTQGGGQGKPTLNQNDAVAVMMEKYEIVKQLFFGFDYKQSFTAETGKQMQLLLDAQEHILKQEGSEKRLKQHVVELSKAFALAVPHQQALDIRPEVAFFQAVKTRLVKITDERMTGEDYSAAIRQIVDKAIAPAGVVDIFAAAGLERPNLSILSDEFLAEVRGMKRKNLAVEALQKLLNDEIKVRFSTNAIKSRKFSELLEQALQRYRNNSIEAAQIIEELIAMAKEMQKSSKEAELLGLSDDEVAFYDALAANGSAREVMGDDQLRALARVLVQRVRNNISVDWMVRDSARARLRVEVKKVLREYGYPPDQEKLAADLVLEQAGLFSAMEAEGLYAHDNSDDPSSFVMR
jgi:type I restriction enzyme R subunit